MSWAPISFVVPSAFSASDAVGGGDISAVLLATPAIDTLDPNEIFTQGPIAGDGKLLGFTKNKFSRIAVHPWVEGVGQGVGAFRYLSPRNAIDTLANKFYDSPDDLTPSHNESMDVLVLCVAGSGYTDLAAKLKGVLKVYSDPTFFMGARRAEQLARLEADKGVLPDAAFNARWSFATESLSESWHGYVKAVGEMACFSDAEAYGEKSAEEAVLLIAKKKAYIAEQVNANAELALSKISGASGNYLLIQNKTSAQIKKILIETEFGADFPLCVCVLYSGAVNALNDLKELFGA
jgi:hypothetical protein